MGRPSSVCVAGSRTAPASRPPRWITGAFVATTCPAVVSCPSRKRFIPARSGNSLSPAAARTSATSPPGSSRSTCTWSHWKAALNSTATASSMSSSCPAAPVSPVMRSRCSRLCVRASTRRAARLACAETALRPAPVTSSAASNSPARISAVSGGTTNAGTPTTVCASSTTTPAAAYRTVSSRPRRAAGTVSASAARAAPAAAGHNWPGESTSAALVIIHSPTASSRPAPASRPVASKRADVTTTSSAVVNASPCESVASTWATKNRTAAYRITPTASATTLLASAPAHRRSSALRARASSCGNNRFSMGAVLYLPTRAGAVRSVNLPHRLSFEHSPDLVGEAVRVERLTEEAVEAALLRALHLLHAGLRGDGDNERVFEALAGAHLFQRLEPVLIRQADVHEDQVDTRQRVGELNHLPARGLPLAARHAHVGQQPRDQHEVGHVVLDDEHVRLGRVDGLDRAARRGHGARLDRGRSGRFVAALARGLGLNTRRLSLNVRGPGLNTRRLCLGTRRLSLDVCGPGLGARRFRHRLRRLACRLGRLAGGFGLLARGSRRGCRLRIEGFRAIGPRRGAGHRRATVGRLAGWFLAVVIHVPHLPSSVGASRCAR